MGSARDIEFSGRLATAAWAPVTKFVAPEPGPEVVFAQQLLDDVADGFVRHPLTLVVAQGGSGKTTLVAAAARSLTRPCAWLQLAAPDDDPVTLLELIALAVEATVPGACGTVLSVASAGQSLAPHQLVGVLVNDLAAAAPLTIVLDDLHVLSDERTLEVVAQLVDAAPPDVTVAVTARHLPPLPVARLRANGLLNEVGVAQLAVDTLRAGEILHRIGVEIDPARTADLVRFANGWLTGLLLAARAPELDLSGNGLDHAIAAYLAEEIITSEGPDGRRFLRCVSILEELEPATCAAVADVPAQKAAELLAGLRRRHGFLVSDHGGTLRLHDLFQRHLRSELEREATEAERSELHRRAAGCTHGAQQVEHLLAAGEQGTAADAVERLVRRWFREPSVDRVLLSWIERLDDDVLATRPWLDLALASIAANRLDRDTAVPLLESVIARSADDEGFERRCLAERLLGLVTHDLASFSDLAELEADARFDRLGAARVSWLLGAAWPELLLGRPESARRRAEMAMSVHRSAPELAAAESVAHHLGPPLAVWSGAVEAFEMHHRWSLEQFGDTSPFVRVGSTVAADVLRLLRGEAVGELMLSPAERELVDQFPILSLDVAARTVIPARWSGDHRAVEAAVHAVLERPGEAGAFGLVLGASLSASHRELRRVDDITSLRDRFLAWGGGPPGEPQVTPNLEIVLAELSWAEGDLDSAAERLTAVADDWSDRFVALQFDPLCELALLRAEQGRRREATSVLAGRLDVLVGRLGQPGRVAMAGPRLVPLLEELADRRSTPAARRVLDVLGRARTADARQIPGSPEVLTGREAEVLDLLASGASNAAIAEQLYISVNTVKTHVKRVLAKLDATSRSEAVARARELRLL